MAARRLPGDWLVVGLAALVFTVGAVGLAALALHAYPRAKPSPVPASRVMTLGRGVDAGHSWTLVGWRTANLRCMTFGVRGGTSTCFRAVPVNGQLGWNRSGAFAFGEVDPDIATVRIRFRDGRARSVATQVPWSTALRGWRYYIALLPAHRRPLALQGLDRTGHVIARTRP